MTVADEQDLVKQIWKLKEQNQELAKQIAVLKQTMETHKQEYKTDIARLAEQMAKRDIETHKRDKDNLRWQLGLWVAAIVILGFIIRFPSVPAVTN